MDIPKTLKEVVSNTPELIDENTIEITRVEKWEVLKSSLLIMRENIVNHINDKQIILNELWFTDDAGTDHQIAFV